MFRLRRRAPSRAAHWRAAADPLAGMTLRQINDLPPWHETQTWPETCPPAPSVEALVFSRVATRSF